MHHQARGAPFEPAKSSSARAPAAEADLADAQSDLAYFYFHGIGVERDYAQPAELMKQAAAQGLPVAQANLGFLYEQAKAVPLDDVAAYAWCPRAIAGGDTGSVEQRKQLARIMTSTQRDLARNATSSICARTRIMNAGVATAGGAHQGKAGQAKGGAIEPQMAMNFFGVVVVYRNVRPFEWS